MGILIEKIKLNLLYNGNGIAENFKNNSLFFYEKYQRSDKDVLSININDVYPGGFYFLHYKDDSNWMKYAPIFMVDYKKFNNMIVLIAINLNFIPMEVRATIFDKFITEKDMDNNNLLKVDYQGVYDELRKYGFEYALMEFNAIQIIRAHKISLELLPRFLYSQHPINIYDPKKLMEIWNAKISKRDQRHKEIVSSMLSEFYDINKEISGKYNVMEDHIKRLQTSLKKYGK